MKKNIDIPNNIRWELEALALKEKKDLKTFIQDLLINLVKKSLIVSKKRKSA